MQFLARSLPNLRYLELGFLEVKDSTIAEPNATKILHLNVALASIDLIRFDIHLEKQTYILIRTNTDNRTRYFFSPNKSMSGMNWKTASHRCVWGTLGQTTHEEVTELSHKMVSLEFNSVKTIYINNMVAA
jgi:hypothetical protein